MSRAVRSVTRTVRRVAGGVGDIFEGAGRAVGGVVGGVSDSLLGTNFTGRYDVPKMDIPEPPSATSSDSGTKFEAGTNTPTTSVGNASDSKFDVDSIFQVGPEGRAGYKNVFEETLRKKRGK